MKRFLEALAVTLGIALVIPLVIWFLEDPPHADTLTIPNSFVTGQTIVADDFNENFQNIENIVNGLIDDDNLKNLGITGSLKLVAGSVTSDELGTDSVIQSKIGTDAVGADEIATGAVGTEEIDDDAVTVDEILDGTIRPLNLDYFGAAPSNMQHLGWNTSEDKFDFLDETYRFNMSGYGDYVDAGIASVAWGTGSKFYFPVAWTVDAFYVRLETAVSAGTCTFTMGCTSSEISCVVSATEQGCSDFVDQVATAPCRGVVTANCTAGTGSDTFSWTALIDE